jgi:hypothetical protein
MSTFVRVSSPVTSIVFFACFSFGCNQPRPHAEERPAQHRAAWMAAGTYGVMVHYLISPPGETPAAKTASFNQTVNGFDLDHFVRQIEASRADWVIFTIGQNTGYYCSPNAYLDHLLPGHTSTRDLPLEIGRRLVAMGKRLIVYLPAEVAGTDPELQRALAWNPPDQREFLRRYQKFVRTYSQQYGRYHQGWWFDGCYDHIHQGKWDWAPWCEAARAGNPDAIVAFNDGAFCVGRIQPVSPLQDYHAGEVHVLEDGQIRLEFLALPDLQRTPDGRLRLPGKEPKLYLPDAQYVDGVQWHALVPIDSTFAYPAIPNMHYSDDELIRFLRSCKAVKGAVTFNVPISPNGHIPEETAAQLVRISTAIAAPPQK